MNITFLSLLLLLFTLYSIGERIVRFIRKEQGQSVFKLMATIFIWSGVSYTALFKLGSENNLNTFFFIGFVIVFFILFRLRFPFLKKMSVYLLR